VRGGTAPPYLPRLDPAEDFTRTAEGLAGLLAEAGFAAAEAGELAWDHPTTVEEWWGGAVGGVATIGLVVTSQDAGTRVRIRRAYERLCARFVPEDAEGEGRLALPHVALLGSAVR
jgi:hypothetical protein